MSAPDPRQQRAEELAASQIRVTSAGYSVPSQSGAGRYTVSLDPLSCTCDDWSLRGTPSRPCKHILAVKLWLDRRDLSQDEPEPCTEPTPAVKRKTYPQSWSEYNAAQTNEKDHFQELLADLCRTIPAPPPAKPGRGRPPIPLADGIFAAIFKVYSTLSARRFVCDLEEAHRRGHVGRVPCFNSVLNALDSEEATPVLHDLIRRSSLPLAAVEHDFAVDSSGFCTSRFVRWYDVKYGVTRNRAEWVKVHLLTGVKTNIVTAVEILDKHAGDSPQLPPLVEATAKGFRVDEVSADGAYASRENFDAVNNVGGTLYAAFRCNATGSIGGLYEKAFHYFSLHREEYLRHYHKRSNVESTFSMCKRKFGDSLRSKTDTAQKNEALAKILCHNIACLISAWYELGIEPVFSPPPADDEPRHVLRFPG